MLPYVDLEQGERSGCSPPPTSDLRVIPSEARNLVFLLYTNLLVIPSEARNLVFYLQQTEEPSLAKQGTLS